MLSFAEELLLLALDDEKGVIIDKTSIGYGLVGALLMDLSLMDRIEVDLDNLRLVDALPTGDSLFDWVLARIARSRETRTVAYWIITLRQESKDIEEQVLERLIHKQILREEEQKILWVFARRRYPMQNDREEKEVKTRIRSVVLSDDIPDSRDVVLISLIKACYLTNEIFSEEELPKVEKRIEQIARMDLIGQTVSRIIESVIRAIAMASLHP
ncbi:GPP34 family phosphoprotein [Candidatus Aerophobetes bacterium]|nr:GPP34 family phosphoprotein [Candidatus Aerophobetes bacterium]